MKKRSICAGAALSLLGCGGGEPVVTTVALAPPRTAEPRALVVAAPTAPAEPRVPHGGASGELPHGTRPARPDGHLAEITCLSFSPDGREVLSGSADRSLLVWDLESGQIVQRLTGHAAFVGACAFLPGGRRVVSAGWGGEVFVWDRATGAIVQRLAGLRSGVDDLYTLSVRADGHEVFVGGRNGRIMAWDLRAPDRPAFDNEEFKNPPDDTVWTVGHMDDGRRFAAGPTGQIRVWGKGPAKNVTARASVALPLGKDRILVGGWDKLLIADLAGKVQDVGAHQGWAGGLAIGPQRDVAVVGDVAGTARLWDLRTFALRCELRGAASLRAAAFHPTGKTFAVAANDGSVVIADADTCTATRTLRADRGRVAAVAAATSVLLGDGMGNVTTWSPEELRLLRADHVHEGGLMGLTLVPGGGWVSAGQDTNLVHAPATGAPHQLFHLRYLPHKLRALEGAPPSVVVVDMSGHAHVVPLDGSTPRDFYSVPGVIFASVAARPGKQEVVIGGSTHTVHKHTLPRGGNGAGTDWATAGAGCTALAYSRDGAVFAEGNSRGEIAIRDPDQGVVQRRLTGLSREVVAIHFTPTHLWAGGFDQKLLRWPLQGGTAAELSIPEGAGIFDIASTADDRYLVVGLDDGAMIHALPDGTPLARLVPFRDLSWAALYADGRYVTSPGAARDMRVEDPRTRRVATLGQPGLPAAVASMLVTSLPGGPARVHATVLSYSGSPQVRLDDRWEIAAVTPSVGNLAAYDVDFLLSDAAGATHRLKVVPPEGDAVLRDFAVPAAVKALPGKPPGRVPVSLPRLTAADLVLESVTVEGAGEGRSLVIEARALEAAESLRVLLQRGAARAEVEAIFAGGHKKGQKTRLRVPIPDELRAGKVEVRVAACLAGQGCAKDAGVGFEVEVR